MRTIVLGLVIVFNIGVLNSAWAEKACYEIQGMTCVTCPITVKAALKKINGIKEVRVSLEEKNAMAEFDANQTNLKEIKNTIESVGYKAAQHECKKI